MTPYQRTKRFHTWAACAGIAFLFILVTVVGPSLD